MRSASGQPRRAQKVVSHEHGWSREVDRVVKGSRASGAPQSAAFYRRANGTPLLLCMMLVMLTLVGLARVHSRVRVLSLAEEITQLTQERSGLLDQRRRLETERAFLRRPARIRQKAVELLDMKATAPERIQVIKVHPVKKTSNPGTSTP